ncbi:MAG: glycoside hydrolase family 108 protein, partial [Rhodospirillaceae bacterium]
MSIASLWDRLTRIGDPVELIWGYAKKATLTNEGGFVDHSSDPGGATNYGVSLRFLRSLGVALGDVDGDGDVDEHDIRALTKDKAAFLFRVKFWRPAKCSEVARSSPALAIKLFDTAVNTGVRQAVRLLQRAINASGVNKPISVDGLIGPQTLGMVRNLDPKRVLRALAREQEAFYVELVANNSDLGVFLKGWRRRARWVPSSARIVVSVLG